MHFLDCSYRVRPPFTRRRKPKLLPKFLPKSVTYSLPNTHCPVTLHVGMPPHWAWACPGTSNVSPQQQKIHDFLNRRHRVPVLGQPHRPTANDTLRPHRNLSRSSNLFPRDPATKKNVIPTRRLHCRDKWVKSKRVVPDKIMVESRAGIPFLCSQHLFHDAFHHRQIAINPNRQP